MKIVHLSNDEKFLPLARSLFEEAFPGQNRYLIAQPRRGAIRHVAPAPDVSHYHSQRFRSRWIARDLASADCAFNGETFFVQGGVVQRVESWTSGPSIEQNDRWTVAALAEAITSLQK